ncbi:MAG: ATP-binding protein [Bilophila wadsworthia]
MATLTFRPVLSSWRMSMLFIHETIPSSYRPLIPQVELTLRNFGQRIQLCLIRCPGEAQVACREVRLDNVPYFSASRCRTGEPLSILEAPVPDVSLGVDERPVGGLGIHLIKSVGPTIPMPTTNSRISSNSISRCPSDPAS